MSCFLVLSPGALRLLIRSLPHRQAVITRSFARIHETNLKKQGMLPLNFKNPADYDKVQPTDFVDLVGVEHLAPESIVTMVLHHKDGAKEEIPLTHSAFLRFSRFGDGGYGDADHFPRFLLTYSFQRGPD